MRKTSLRIARYLSSRVLYIRRTEDIGTIRAELHVPAMQLHDKKWRERRRPLGKCGSVCVVLLAHHCHLSRAWSASQHQLPLLTMDRPRTSLLVRFIGTETPEDAALSSRIRDAYESGETDGILELAGTLSLQDYSPQELVVDSLEAAKGNKGQAAGMINAWVGACHDTEPALALQLLEAYDDISDEVRVYPDVVTLSLVYSALCRVPEYEEVAAEIMDRARKLSKKLGGSKRRRALAASRRKGPGVMCKGAEEDIQQLCGLDFRVLRETEELVVLSKPSGMVCFHRRATTAGKVRKRKKGQNDTNRDVSLVDALVSHNVPLSTLNSEARGLVHRIDRGTSGCIVLAKTDDMHAKLLTQFFLRRAKKRYIAVVSSSTMELECHGEINSPVDGRPAKSRYSLLGRHGSDAVSLEVETFTGRKHQVRVHCAQGLDSPILLDPIYAEGFDYPPAIACWADNQRFFLHASSLAIPDYDVDVHAPLPTWWEEAIPEINPY